MRLSLLASIALTAATLLPVHSLESEARFPPSIESEATPSSEGGPLHVTDTFLGIFKCEWRHLFNWSLLKMIINRWQSWRDLALAGHGRDI